MGKPRALVFGRRPGTIEAIPTLLSRAGFDVALITSSRELRTCRNVERFVLVERSEVVPRAFDEVSSGYDLVVPTDDDTLRRIRRSTRSVAEKLSLLPTSTEAGLEHIASKIGLSRVLAAAGVRTPAFAVAETVEQLRNALALIRLPAMIKSDFGAGGFRVVRVESIDAKLPAAVRYPVLVQEVIEGEMVDCSAFFRDRELVTFSYSVVVEAERGGYGPTILRRYRVHPERDASLLGAMRALGRALDADGFCNVTAIRSSSDGELYFFEADMRPNTWVEHPKFIGADPALAIAAAFGLPRPVPHPSREPAAATATLAYLPRLKVIDILLNRHNCRSHYENYTGRNVILDRIARYCTTLTSPLVDAVSDFTARAKRKARRLMKRLKGKRGSG